MWRKCSSCKKEIALNSKYYECSVSTCTGARTGYVFCSVNCWEVHLPGARHRDAGAVEKRSPMTAEAVSESAPRRILVSNPSSSVTTGGGGAISTASVKSPMSQEVLVVVSKMKQYIRDISDMNTADEVSRVLSDLIRAECEKAVHQARADGRKTVMARDFSVKK